MTQAKHPLQDVVLSLFKGPEHGHDRVTVAAALPPPPKGAERYETAEEVLESLSSQDLLVRDSAGWYYLAPIDTLEVPFGVLASVHGEPLLARSKGVTGTMLPDQNAIRFVGPKSQIEAIRARLPNTKSA